jgi:hypothetical protein
MAHHEHSYEEEQDTYGLAIGFRIFDDAGGFFLAEAEIAPYVDEPEELGVTLVFHPLDGVNPVQVGEDVDWPSWPLDIDDDLTRDPGGSMEAQFSAIVRQLHDLKPDRLREYLHQARLDAAESEVEG